MIYPTAQSDWTDRLALAPQVAIDEAVVAVMRTRQPAPSSTTAPEQLHTELADMVEFFDSRGWLSAPATYHRTPPPLLPGDIAEIRQKSGPLRHETMTFSSGFRPRADEPGAERWTNSPRNDTVFVRMLRHPTPAPWVVCLHGFGMGATRFDLNTMWARHLHTKHRFNVAVPVAPLHGPRRTADDNQLLSLDLTQTVHGISQALWDVRRLISWLRADGGTPVGVYGLSLGGYLAALLAGLEPVDAIVAAVPIADVPQLMKHHRPPPGHIDVLSSETARDALRVISPLAVPPQLAGERLTLLSARGDRLIPSQQSAALAEAWPTAHVHRCNTGHVGFTWSREARRRVADRLSAGLLTG